MKLQCPECKANYNLDISKIPAVTEKGITVTCPKCKHKFPLEIKPEETTPGSAQKEEIIIPCPSCGHVNLSSKKCAGCGRVFTEEELKKIKITLGG